MLPILRLWRMATSPSPFFLTMGDVFAEQFVDRCLWYVLNTAANGSRFKRPHSSCRSPRLATFQAKSATRCSPGVGEDQVILSIAFDGEGTFGGDDSAISCGCTNPEAGNYDPSATYDDGSCELMCPAAPTHSPATTIQGHR